MYWRFWVNRGSVLLSRIGKLLPGALSPCRVVPQAYTETKEHMGGFWILEAADMDEALAWARKAAISWDAAGEVRELLFYPAPEQGPGESK